MSEKHKQVQRGCFYESYNKFPPELFFWTKKPSDATSLSGSKLADLKFY